MYVAVRVQLQISTCYLLARKKATIFWIFLVKPNILFYDKGDEMSKWLRLLLV